ncbi:MAG: arylsulfatase, partial [Prevotella conceptionensis]
MQNQTLRTALKRGFLFFSATVLLLTLQFLFVLFTSNTLDIMSPLGYLFFFASCLSHAACLALPPYLIYMLIACTGCVRIARVVHFVLVA